jgi:GntR family transcriptional regulator
MKSHRLSKDNETPLYIQLARIIEEDIANHHYQKGGRLPSEQELVQAYGISRVTVRQTMKHLADNGVVVRRQGLGTFVKNTVVKTTIDELVGFYPSLMRHGIHPAIKTLDYRIITPEPHVREILRLSGADKVLKFIRQYFIDDAPFLFTEIYIPSLLAEKWSKEEADAKNTLQLIKEKTDLYITHSDVSIRSSSAKGLVASCLDLQQGSPILELQRVMYVSGNQPVEFAISRYRGDSYELTTTISVTEQNKLLVTTSQRMDNPSP